MRIIFVNWKWEDLFDKYVEKKVNNNSLLIFSNYRKNSNGVEKFLNLISSIKTKNNQGYYLIFTHKNKNSNNITKADLRNLIDEKTEIEEFEGGKGFIYFDENKKIGLINENETKFPFNWNQLKNDIVTNFDTIWDKYWRSK